MDAGEHQESDLGDPKLRIFELPNNFKGSRTGKGASMLKVSVLHEKIKGSGQKYLVYIRKWGRPDKGPIRLHPWRIYIL